LIAPNVTQFNANTVHNKVMAFIKQKARKSEKTAEAYETDFRQFCKVALGKELEQIKDEDLAIDAQTIVRYQDFLCEVYKGSSVNRKMSSIRTILKYLAIDNKLIRMEVFNAVEAMPKMTKHYGVLDKEEVDQMIELAKELPNGQEKSALIWLAFQTGIRLNALLNLEWKDIKRIKNVWVVTVYDKGKKYDEKPIPDALYDYLTKIGRTEGKVFNMTPRTAQRTIDELCERMGIDPERNITFHSLKKAGINYILETTGDIDLAAKFGNHKTIQTTYESYANRNKDYTEMPSYTMGQEIDLSPLEKLSKEELIEIIKSCKDSTKIEIISKLV
jgi:integrase